MIKYEIFLAALFFVMLSALSACDNSEKESVGAGVNKINTVDACNLLTQEEVDGLFAESPGPGGSNSPAPHLSTIAACAMLLAYLPIQTHCCWPIYQC